MPTSNNREAGLPAAAVRHVDAPAGVVHSTLTASGRIVDWVPIESQVADGRIATPPPTSPSADENAQYRAEFEEGDQGPAGTVPILRDLIEHRERTLRAGADKRNPGNVGRSGGPRHAATAPPDPFGYYHATTAQNGAFYGASASIGVWDPAISMGSDHSLMQLGLLNFDNPAMQSLEAGWTVDRSLNGDALPHVFTYFTTNGYSSDGPAIGGYNQVANAWVQYDANAYPGIGINGVSVIGGSQLEISLKYQLWQGNWWFQVQGVWLGYYPASLFGTGAMSTKAEWAGFWGEVYSGLADPTQTVDQMGSGRFAGTGFGNACFQHNISVQTATDGTMADANGSASAENSAYYDINQVMVSGGSWGSYFYAGGSGHGTAPIVVPDDAGRQHSNA